MKNIPLWRPSKYEYRKGILRGSRDEKDLSLSSRLLADIVAGFYQKYLKSHAKGRLADLGCGKVPLYCEYKKYVDEVTCIDWAESFHKNPHLDTVCNLNEPLPLPDSCYDTIILSDVLEHIAEPQLLCNEMGRILKPGGKVFINVPFYYRLHEMPHDYYRYTEYALRYLCKGAGLNIILIETLGGIPEILTDITTKNTAYKPVIGKPVAQLIHFLYKVFLVTKIGKNIARKTSVTFPYGYFIIAEKQQQNVE